MSPRSCLSSGFAVASSILAGILAGCTSGVEPAEGPALSALADDLPQREGSPGYLASPYVTAGDRVYMVGHQDGQFPDLGFHVEGEMGGIWNHPIKLMDGFVAGITGEASGTTTCLTGARRFVNYPLANKHVYETDGLRVERFQFVPDGLQGLVVEYVLENPAPEPRALAFTFTGLIDLTPVWLAARKGIADGPDAASWDARRNVVAARDSLNDWFVVFGAGRAPAGHAVGPNACSVSRKGKGVDASLTITVTVEAGGRAVLPFYIAGSYHTLDDALRTYQTLLERPGPLLQEKKARYASLKAAADLSIPDDTLQQMYTWMKYNTDWLVRDVPEVGRGLSAGIPDYPWWFGADNAYALQGVLATGRPELVKSTLHLLHDLSEAANGNGRIIHEVSTNGVVFNPGNLNETPHFAVLVWQTYQWTGDRDLLAALYPTIKRGLAWLLTEQDQDGNLYPDGAGMMEIHGLDSEMIDVVVYTQQAFEAAAHMAAAMDEPEQAQAYAETARLLSEKINADWWVDEAGSFADFKASTRKTLDLLDDAVVRADTLGKPWAVEELQAARRLIARYPPGEKRGHVLYHNWVVNTPMEMGVADADKALRALETGRRYTNPFGVYVTGIDRDEARDEAAAGSRKWKTFSYVGAVMTLPTGVQAVAEGRYGRPDRAYSYLKMLARSFDYALPGSMYEVSPDYGMIVQAWNVYAVAVPIVHSFFGIQPRAYDEHVTLRPRMPEGWNDARLENLPVGDNTISVAKRTQDGTVTYTVDQTKAHWTIDVNLPRMDGAVIEVNGAPPEALQDAGAPDERVVRVSGSHNEITMAIP